MKQEYNWESKNNLNIHAVSYKPSAEPDAAICLVHGLGEHSGRYDHVAKYFVNKNIAFNSMDLRGHGLSGGKRGHCSDYEFFMDDIELLISNTKKQFPNCPMILYGHSLGGNLVLNYSLFRENNFQLLIATSPWLKLSFDPPKLKVKLAQLIGKIYPALTQKTNLNPLHLSQNKQVGEEYKIDPLVHDYISVSTYLSILNAGNKVLENDSGLSTACLIMHGEDDYITSAKASKEFVLKNKQKTELKLWQGCYHELHNEKDQSLILDYLFGWIKRSLDIK